MLRAAPCTQSSTKRATRSPISRQCGHRRRAVFAGDHGSLAAVCNEGGAHSRVRVLLAHVRLAHVLHARVLRARARARVLRARTHAHVQHRALLNHRDHAHGCK